MYIFTVPYVYKKRMNLLRFLFFCFVSEKLSFLSANLNTVNVTHCMKVRKIHHLGKK